MENLVARLRVGDAHDHAVSEDFRRVADEFAALQQEQQRALLAGNCKDLFSWRQSREQVFRGIARMLEQVVACGQEDKECIAHVQDILGKLLVEEGVLEKLIATQRLKVQEQLLAMRKGKEALQGYNINKGLVPRPRYLSNRM